MHAEPIASMMQCATGVRPSGRKITPAPPRGKAMQNSLLKARTEDAIRIVPTGKPIGADIVGVALSKPLSDDQFKVIFDAWMDRQVLRFRGQDLTKEQLLA